MSPSAAPTMSPLPTSAEQLLARLGTLGIAAVTHHHPPVFTVEESQALRGSLPGVHCKNLLLRDRKHRLWLLVCREDCTLNLKSLRDPLGASASLSFATPEILFDVLGVTPGSVTPFGLINDKDHQVTPVIDAALLTYPQTYFHPLRNDMSTAIAPRGLLDFIKACGHHAVGLDLDVLPPQKVDISLFSS